MINIGIIGLGYWGRNYVRIIDELEETKVSWCCDTDETTDIAAYWFITDCISGLKDVQAVVVATPASTHYKIVKYCLLAGKDVLVEKPLALNSKDAKELVEIAKKGERILMVGHTFIYNPAVRKLKDYIASGYLGNLYYLYFTRTGLGPIREDVNALWDLAPHDISMLSYLLDAMPIDVSAMGQAYIQKGVGDVMFMSLRFPNNILAGVHVSWLGPRKIRQVTIVGSKRMVVFDDVNRLEPLKIFDKGIDHKSQDRYTDQFQVRDGDIHIPKIEMSEPLKNQCEHFSNCIQKQTKPLTDGENGLRVIQVLERLERSLTDINEMATDTGDNVSDNTSDAGTWTDELPEEVV